MEKKEAERVRHMERFLQYMYQNAKSKENILSHIEQPVAIYRYDGRIAEATGLFRSLAGITCEDIKQGKASIFDCLNSELTEAARNTDSLKSFDNLSHPIRTKIPSAEKLSAEKPSAEEQASEYTHAAVFPVTLSFKDTVLGAVYLLNAETEDERKDKYCFFGFFRI